MAGGDEGEAERLECYTASLRRRILLHGDECESGASGSREVATDDPSRKHDYTDQSEPRSRMRGTGYYLLARIVMILALDDTNELHAFADLADANREVEGYDAESGAVRFFDASGRQLEPIFPLRDERRFLGIRLNNDPGRFELAPAAGGEPGLAVLLDGNTRVAPNPWFPTIEAVRAALGRINAG